MIRLQTRLFLTFISVALVALTIVALFALQAIRQQFDAYVIRDQIIVLNQTAQLFDEPVEVAGNQVQQAGRFGFVSSCFV